MADDPAAIDRGFGVAMVIGAGLLGAAAVVSWVGLVLPVDPAPTRQDRLDVHRNPDCAVCGPARHPGEQH